MGFKKFGDAKKIKVVNHDQSETQVKKCPICGELYMSKEEHAKKCEK